MGLGSRVLVQIQCFGLGFMGFGVEGLGIRGSGLGFGALGLRVKGVEGFRVWGVCLRLRV